jgi:menaquinone-dependent protoporphyrinogen IX oxidase
MWTVVYMAQSKEIATKLQELLTEEGILVKVRPISKNHENSDNYFEVLVPEAEVEEAHSVIIEKGF